MKNKKRNAWKIAFLILSATLLGFAGVIVQRISTQPKQEQVQKDAKTNQNVTTIATLSTNKEQVNSYISDVINKSALQKNHFSFKLENKVVLSGSYSILGVDVPLYLYLVPYTQEDGNILLQVEGLSAGTLNLSAKAILSFVKDFKQFPDYIEFNASEGNILVRLDKMNIAQGMKVKANMIDLVNDKFEFTLYKESKKK